VLLVPGVALAAYRVRFSHHIGGGCDFRVGWYVELIGERLFVGGPWDQNDCGVYGYGLRLYDVETGAFERELRGTYAVASAGSNVFLGHVDGVQVVDPATLDVTRLLVGPNPNSPWLRLYGSVDGDVVAGGAPDTLESSGRIVVFRLDPETGAVVQRYVLPRVFDEYSVTNVAAHGDVVAIGAFPPNDDTSSATGVFVFDADDGALRWSTSTPPGDYSGAVGHSVAVDGEHVFVGVPRLQKQAQVRVFASKTGQLVKVLESPMTPGGRFGRSVAVDDARLLVGAPLLDRAFLFDTTDWSLIATLEKEGGEEAIGDAVALRGDVAAASGNYYDGEVYVFEPDPTPSTTSTTAAPSSTSTTLASTTSTTLLHVCDDGDDCTVDTSVDGRCVFERGPGVAGFRCRLDQVRASVGCAPPGPARRLALRLRRLSRVVDALINQPSPTRATQRVRRRLDAHCRHVARLESRGRVDLTCRAALEAVCDESGD